MSVKILVCGGRDFEDFSRLDEILEEITKDFDNPPHIIHGGANGADSLAGNWAYMNYCPCTVYPARWSKYKKSAGPIRNQQMLDEGKPDLVVAFPGGVGTADMIRRAKKANIKVIEV